MSARREVFIRQRREQIANLSLGEKQELFMLMQPLLIQYAYLLGYRVRGGDLFRSPNTCSHGHQPSAHHFKLAFDVNLMKDGVLLADGSGHDVLHDFWDMMGGSERISNDLNHYSIEHNGVR